METRKRRVISLLVDNQSGVLARVSSLFCRRGFNIDSLTVSATNDPTVSRITVTVSGSDKELQQLILQTERLEVTRQVFVLDHDKALERELLLLKVEADVHNRAELREVGRSLIFPRTVWCLSSSASRKRSMRSSRCLRTIKFWSCAAPA